jgi:hypothetical protein
MAHPLIDLHIGNSVAEFDASLTDYFVETAMFHDLIHDRGDIVAGDKGTGKSALFRRLAQGGKQLEALRHVELMAAFNVSGNPVFQRLTEQKPPLSEGQYITVWKCYFISLVGNWILQFFEGNESADSRSLEQLLDATGLRAKDDEPSTIFSSLANLVRRILTPKSFEVELTLTESGLPIVVPKIELGDLEVDHERHLVRHESALALVDRLLKFLEVKAWIILDRLDEAFQGHPETEIPALRGLLRTYLDLQAYSSLRLKIFVRNDLFRRITKGGFVNLSHVNARRIDIIWKDDDLYALLLSRIRKSSDFLDLRGLSNASDDEIFSDIFPDQVEKGEKQRETWGWLLSRIRDGNDVKPPRNLIDLVNKAKDAQLRKSAGVTGKPSAPLIEPESIKRGQEAMSKARVEDTLLAETGSLADIIYRFKDGKAEQSLKSIAALLNANEPKAKEIVEQLAEVGFLESIGESYKVPMLYREGLNMTQGKAF